MNTNKKFSVCIIGAGIIGSGFIKEKKYFNINKKLSHIGVVSSSAYFSLDCVIDKDALTRKELSKYLDCNIFSRINDIPEKKEFDLISICVPDQYHYTVLNEVVKLNPKLVIIEKPISDHPDNTNKIISLYNKNKIKLIVNYTRKFIPFYQSLAKELRSQKIISSQVLYGNGLMHNGCHIIDLFKTLFGEISSYKVLSNIKDYSSQDPTVSMFLKTKKCSSCFIIALDNRKFTHWEMNIYTDYYHYKIYNDHRDLLIEKVKDNTGIPLGKRFVFYKNIKIDYDAALKNLYIEARHNLLNKNSWKRNLQSIIDTEKLSYKIVKDVLK